MLAGVFEVGKKERDRSKVLSTAEGVMKSGRVLIYFGMKTSRTAGLWQVRFEGK